MSFRRLLIQRMKGYRQQAIILCLFSLMFSFLFLGCIVSYSIYDYAKQNVGKYVKGSIKIKSCEDDDEKKFSAEGQEIPFEWIQELSKRKEIKNYEMLSMAGVHGVDIKHMDLYDDELNKEDEKGNLLLVYQKNMKNYYLFHDLGYTILDGRWIEEDESGYKAVISKTTAEQHNKSVGDQIQLCTLNGDPIFLEIVGISTYEFDGSGVSLIRACPYNYIFTTKEVVDKANLSENVFEVEFELADCKESGLVENSIQEELKGNDFIINKKLSGYHTILAALTNNQTTIFLLLVASLVMSAVITGLFSVYSLTERLKEIGILISLGMKRRNIILQYILELFIPVVFGNIVCLGVFYMVRPAIISYMTDKIKIIPELTLSLHMIHILAFFSCVCFMMIITLIYISYKVITNKPKELLIEAN